jgi:hypothetical protein
MFFHNNVCFVIDVRAMRTMMIFHFDLKFFQVSNIGELNVCLFHFNPPSFYRSRFGMELGNVLPHFAWPGRKGFQGKLLRNSPSRQRPWSPSNDELPPSPTRQSPPTTPDELSKLPDIRGRRKKLRSEDGFRSEKTRLAKVKVEKMIQRSSNLVVDDWRAATASSKPRNFEHERIIDSILVDAKVDRKLRSRGGIPGHSRQEQISHTDPYGMVASGRPMTTMGPTASRYHPRGIGGTFLRAASRSTLLNGSDDSSPPIDYNGELFDLTRLILALEQETELNGRKGNQPASFALDSEVQITEALFPSPEFNIDPSPKRTALCFELLRKLLKRTGKVYSKLASRLLTEVQSAIYAPQGYDAPSSATVPSANRLIQEYQTYFQLNDALRHQQQALEEKIANLQVVVTRQRLSNQKRAAALGAQFARRSIDTKRRFFKSWREEIMKGKRILTKMTKKFKKIYFLGLYNNARKRKLRRYKERIKDLEDPLEKQKQENELKQYREQSDKFEKQLKLALFELKETKAKLLKNQRDKALSVKKSENEAASKLLKPMLDMFETIRTNRNKRLSQIFVDFSNSNVAGADASSGDHLGDENTPAASQSTYHKEVQSYYNKLKLRLEVCHKQAYSNLCGEDVPASPEPSPDDGWHPGQSVATAPQDGAPEQQRPKPSKRKQVQKERKKKQIEQSLLALSLRGWTSQEITVAANHANNEAKAKGQTQEISPALLETLVTRVSSSELQTCISADLLAIFGPGYIDVAIVLLDHLYADWSNELEADDLHQMVPEEQFTAGKFQKNIKYFEMKTAIDHVNMFSETEEEKVTPTLAASLLFISAETNLTRTKLIECFGKLVGVETSNTAFEPTVAKLLKKLDSSSFVEVKKQAHWTRCRDMRYILRGALPNQSRQGGVDYLKLRQNMGAQESATSLSDNERLLVQFPWVLESPSRVNVGVDDVEALIIAWSRLFTKGAVENLGASLRSSVVYGDLIKYLSQQLERLEGPRSGNVGEATFGEKIDNATRKLDLHQRASELLAEMHSFFNLPKELIKEAEVVDGDSEWSFEMLAFLFTVSGTGLEPPETLLKEEEAALKGMDETYLQLKVKALSLPPRKAFQVVQRIKKLFEDIDVLEASINGKIEGVREGHAMWQSACTHITKIVYENLSRRARGVHSLAQIRNEKSQASVYSRLRPERMQDILLPKSTDKGKRKKDAEEVPEEEADDAVKKTVTDIETFLASHHASLRRIYKAYAAQGGGGVAIKQEQFIKFCKDCKIPDKKFTEHMLPIVFIRANWDDPNADKSKKVAAVLNPSEYIEALVRLAAAKYTASDDILPRKVKRLVDHHVLPHAQRSDVDNFRRSLRTEEMQSVLKKHESNLMSTFKKYAQAELSHKAASATFGDVHKDTINYSEFSVFMKDKKLLDATLSNKMVVGIFNNVQSEAEAVSEDDMMALEMDYGEFCEAIIAIAAWKMPSPFLAFDQRVDTFLSMVLFRNSGDKKKKKGGKRK